jgi:hypothetical protein
MCSEGTILHIEAHGKVLVQGGVGQQLHIRTPQTLQFGKNSRLERVSTPRAWQDATLQRLRAPQTCKEPRTTRERNADGHGTKLRATRKHRLAVVMWSPAEGTGFNATVAKLWTLDDRHHISPQERASFIKRCLFLFYSEKM